MRRARDAFIWAFVLPLPLQQCCAANALLSFRRRCIAFACRDAVQCCGSYLSAGLSTKKARRVRMMHGGATTPPARPSTIAGNVKRCRCLPAPRDQPPPSIYCVLALCACHFRESDTAFRPLLLANRPSLLLPLHAIADFRLAPHDLLALLSWAFSFNPDGTFAAL